MASTNPQTEIEPIAPYTGILRYPREALLTLAFSILRDLAAHYQAAYEKAGAEGDEEAEAEAIDHLQSFSSTFYVLDKMGWKAHFESDGEAVKWTELTQRTFDDPRSGEKGLLRLSRIGSSAWYVREACERRLKLRGEAPASDPSWKKENALLDLLQFFSISEHEGLFALDSPVPPDGGEAAEDSIKN